MKVFKVILKSVFVVFAVGLSALILFFYLQDERLKPEAQEFLKLTDTEAQLFEESRAFLIDERMALKADLAKSAPCDMENSSPDDEINFAKSWEEFQSSTKHFETFIQPYLKTKGISVGGSDMSDTFAGINSSRHLYAHIHAQQCFYQLKKMNEESTALRSEVAEFLVRSLNAPNIALSRLIGFGMVKRYLSDFSQNPEMEKFRQAVSLYLKDNNAEDIFWNSARHDIIMLNNNLINIHNKKLGLEETFEHFVTPRGKLINKAWFAFSKRQFPELPAELSDTESNWLSRPTQIMTTYEIVAFSSWSDSRKRLQKQWDEMNMILSTDKTN